MERYVAIDRMNRTGIAICRELVKSGIFTVSIINDSTLPVDRIAYLLNYDSNGQGLIKAGYCAVADIDMNIINFYKGTSAKNGTFINTTYVYRYISTDIELIPLGPGGVEYVFECDSNINTKEKLQNYLNQGAKAVLLCANPFSFTELSPFILGISSKDSLTSGERMLFSLGSPQVQATAMLLSAFKPNEINNCMIEFVSPYNSDQCLIDGGYTAELELSRAAGRNIIPLQNNSIKYWIRDCSKINYEGVIVQEFRTPTLSGSMIHLGVYFNIIKGIDEINESLANVISTIGDESTYNVTDKPLVSSDAINTEAFVTPIIPLTNLLSSTTAYITALYDEEKGYALQAIKTMIAIAEARGIYENL